jgi:membrane protein
VNKVVLFFRLARAAFGNLKQNDPIRMAAATAFFCFFALPPIVIILSQLYGSLFDGQDEQVSMHLFRKLAGLFGYQSARQLQDISEHLQQRRSSTLFTVISVVLLFVTSTTLFTIIKNSLNQLWNVRPAENRPVGYVLVDKLIALGIIIFAGFLVTTSISAHRFMWHMQDLLPYNAMGHEWSRQLFSHSLSILLLTAWFAIVFKYLPDIRIRWSAIWVGAVVTALLIEMGEQVLDLLLINSPVSSFYGTSGAIILILLFVFYASLIVYFGASFTRQYTQLIHLEAQPGANAVAYQIKEVTEKKSISAK